MRRRTEAGPAADAENGCMRRFSVHPAATGAVPVRSAGAGVYMRLDQGLGMRPVGRDLDTFARMRRQRAECLIGHQVDQERVRHMLAHRLQIDENIVDEHHRLRPLAVQGQHRRALGLFRRDHRVVEAMPGQQGSPRAPVARRHRGQEHDVGLGGQPRQAVGRRVHRRLPCVLGFEERFQHLADGLAGRLAAVGAAEDISMQAERRRLQFMAVVVEIGHEGGDEFEHDLVDVADDQRPLTEMQIIMFRVGDKHRHASLVPPSAWKAREIVSGLVSVAAQKASSVGSWPIRKPSTPARNPGSLAASRRLEASSPVSARKRPISSGSPESQTSTAIAVSSAIAVLSFRNHVHGIRNDRLPLFQPNGTKVTAMTGHAEQVLPGPGQPKAGEIRRWSPAMTGSGGPTGCLDREWDRI